MEEIKVYIPLTTDRDSDGYSNSYSFLQQIAMIWNDPLKLIQLFGVRMDPAPIWIVTLVFFLLSFFSKLNEG